MTQQHTPEQEPDHRAAAMTEEDWADRLEDAGAEAERARAEGDAEAECRAEGWGKEWQP